MSVKIDGRSTVNTVLNDPAASEWLKGALRAALKCDPSDVFVDARTLARLMMRYMGARPRKEWPGSSKTAPRREEDKGEAA